MLHTMAKRFFLPLNVVAVPDKDTGAIVLRGINDSPANATIALEAQAVSMTGAVRTLGKKTLKLPTSHAVDAMRLGKDALKDDEFLFFAWRDGDGALIGENDFFPKAYKYYDLPRAHVKAAWSEGENGPQVRLSSDHVALFVTATSDMPGHFSDNGVTLLPGRATTLTFTPRHGAKATAKTAAKGFRVRNLSETH